MMAKKKVSRDPTLADWLGDEVKRLPPGDLVQALDGLYAAGPSAGEQQAAQTALTARLKAELPDPVYYGTMEHSPLGPVWVAVSGGRLVAVEYDGSEEEFVAFLAKLSKGQARRDEARVARIKDEVLAYLRGERTSWGVEVDLSGISDFQRRVLEEARRVPRGQVATYGEIAVRIGQPKAARAVGQALRRNPVPIVVPCHRVVASDGKLGGYAGEMDDERKVKLLKLEGVVFA